jgi:hypothetical protein
MDGKRYTVFFFWNHQGASVIDWVLSCELPAGVGPHTVSRGFWVDDSDYQSGKSTYLPNGSDGKFWVPPGRITGLIPSEETRK